MIRFPYMTEYVNQAFVKEKARLDYIFLRPILLILYFFLRLVIFPLKFFVHRVPYGFEARCIDATMAFGLKYFASHEAAELMRKRLGNCTFRLRPESQMIRAGGTTHDRENRRAAGLPAAR